MKRLSCACLLLGAALAGDQLRAIAADAARFRYVAAAYLDDKGAGLNLPEGVACDRNGTVVVADTGNNRLVRFSYRERGLSGGAEIKPAELGSPGSVFLGSKGDIYALDTVLRRIVHLTPAGEFREALKLEGAPGAASVVAKAFALDSADNIYVLDVFSARVLVLNPEGQFQKAIAVADDTGFASDIAVDASGAVILIDSVGKRIYAAAKDAPAFTRVGGDLAQYLPTLPTHVTTVRGAILVGEGNAGTITAFARDGAFLSRQLTTGWSEGMLNHPSQMCVSDTDVFIADRDNSRVQVFQLIR
jgi:DNA-binding beta-propeller fold protein YncE